MRLISATQRMYTVVACRVNRSVHRTFRSSNGNAAVAGDYFVIKQDPAGNVLRFESPERKLTDFNVEVRAQTWIEFQFVTGILRTRGTLVGQEFINSDASFPVAPACNRVDSG